MHDNSGYHAHPNIKPMGIEYLESTNLNYESIINDRFTLAFGCMFVVTNSIMNDIFKTLTIPPINKDGSCVYERTFGLYFILKNINTVNIRESIHKNYGKRY